jgi:tyrosine-protein phosphatase YwqE
MSINFKKIFSKEKSLVINKSKVITDIHSHLIPGIDDGVQTIEESIFLIRELESIGIKKIITSPHIKGEIFENTPEIILNGLEKLKAEIKKQGISIEIEVCAEYFIDDYFINKIRNNEKFLTFGNKQKFILVEFSYFGLPIQYKSVFFDLQSKGYTVVLAHPERYYYLHNNFDKYIELYDRGALLQLNLVSLTGFYDNASKKIANKLIDEGLYSFIGTDTHNIQYINSLKKVLSSKTYNKIFDKCTILNDL